MRIKKILNTALLFAVISLMLCSCKNIIAFELSPARQANTNWSSSDGSITFHIDDSLDATGEITVDGETHKVAISFGISAVMHVYSADILEDTEEPYEHEDEYYLKEKWSCVFISKSAFYATVKESTYFDSGDVITFKRVDEETEAGEK